MAKITDLTVQKRDNSRFNLFVDESFFCGLHVNVVAKHNLYKGLEIEQEKLDEILKDDLYQRFLIRTSKYLDRAIRSEKQTRDYVTKTYYKKKGEWFSEEFEIDLEDLSEYVVSKLRDVGIIDDYRYATAFVSSRIRLKPRSKFVLVGELYGKGIDKELASQVCDELIDDEYELMLKTYQKKYKDEPLYNGEQKKIDYLRRKGYSWDLISELIEDDVRE